MPGLNFRSGKEEEEARLPERVIGLRAKPEAARVAEAAGCAALAAARLGVAMAKRAEGRAVEAHGCAGAGDGGRRERGAC